MTEIENKVIVITGASSGVGAATARVLAARGAAVVLGARRAGPLRELADEIGAAGGRAAWREVDVRRLGDVTALVELARTRFGRLDVLVASAGIAPNSLLDELRLADWIATVEVNVLGVLYGIAAALPVFRAQGGGHLVALSSSAALSVRPTMAVYAGAKMAVRGICEGLRQEAGADLRVTLITPGLVDTPFAEGIADDETRERYVAARNEFGLPPAAVAEAIAYAIGQPATVDVGEIVIRPTAQA